MDDNMQQQFDSVANSIATDEAKFNRGLPWLVELTIFERLKANAFIQGNYDMAFGWITEIDKRIQPAVIKNNIDTNINVLINNANNVTFWIEHNMMLQFHKILLIKFPELVHKIDREQHRLIWLLGWNQPEQQKRADKRTGRQKHYGLVD